MSVANNTESQQQSHVEIDLIKIIPHPIVNKEPTSILGTSPKCQISFPAAVPATEPLRERGSDSMHTPSYKTAPRHCPATANAAIKTGGAPLV